MLIATSPIMLAPITLLAVALDRHPKALRRLAREAGSPSHLDVADLGLDRATAAQALAAGHLRTIELRSNALRLAQDIQ